MSKENVGGWPPKFAGCITSSFFREDGIVHSQLPSLEGFLLQLLETASRLVVGQMVTRQKRMTARMAQLEDFEIIASSHKAGAHPSNPKWLNDSALH